MSESSTIFYRFRSAEALLGKYDELARREIYFASPDELNDPLEGYADVLWHGDAILWTSLLRHYLLVLTHAVTMAALTGADFNPEFLSAVAESTDEDLPEGPVREIYAEICSKFLAADLPVRWIATLTDRDLAFSREELAGFLLLLHPLTLHVVLRAFDAADMPTPLSSIDFTSGFGAMVDQFSAWLHLYDEAPETRIELHSIAESNFLQMELLRGLGTLADPRKKGWLFLLTDFPGAYVQAIEALLYPEWRTACFVTDPCHASMWGVYADSHKGVCLALRSQPDSAGRATLRLHGYAGRAYSSDGEKPIFQDVAMTFNAVRYANDYPPTDFFRSLGSLSRSKLDGFWYSDGAGTRSVRTLDILAEDETWRRGYWARNAEIVSTKLRQWEHEEEHRLVTYGPRRDLSEKKYFYRLEDLEGVIFGIKTSQEHKLAIIRSLAASVAREGVGADTIQFSQAAFSRAKGCIEMRPLSLLTSQFSKLVAACADIPEVRPDLDLSALQVGHPVDLS